MSGVTWSSAARGERVIPCLLIAGLPVILIPGGVTLTGWTAGLIDAAWWPGSSFSGFSAYLRSWLSLSDGIEWEERAQPVQPEMLDIGAMTVHVNDPGLRADGTGGAATALFAQRDSIEATWITADVTTSTTTVAVSSTDGFPASGFIYVGRETMAYSSKTSTSFAVGTVANRGRFGSPVQHHWYVGNGNAAIANPEVTSAAPEIIGRTALLFWLRVTGAGVVTEGSLAYYGSIGAGVVLDDGSERWSLRIDHAVKRLALPLRGETVSVSGYVSDAPEAAQGVTSETLTGFPCTYERWIDSSGSLYATNILTTAAASPNNGGWHPTSESYVESLNLAGSTILGFTSLQYQLVGGRLRMSADYGANLYEAFVGWGWDRPSETSLASIGTDNDYTSGKQFPTAWVPIVRDSKVYLSASDWSFVPAIPSSPIASVYYLVAFGDGDDAMYARITSKASSGGRYWLVVSAVTSAEDRLDSFGFYAFGFIVTEPSSARLAVEVEAATWIDAIEALLTSFDVTLGDISADVFDFTDMRAVVAQYPAGPFATNRRYVVDLTTNILELVTNECRLNGFTLVLRNGRISITRISDFAPTEESLYTLTTSDLHIDEPRPRYARGHDAIVNAMKFVSKQTGITVNVVDATSLSRYGAGRTTLEANAPDQITGTAVNLAGAYLELARQAATVLGPLRYPYEYVMVSTTLAFAGIQVGDLVMLDLWRVPDQQTARGISKLGQVLSRSWRVYGTDSARMDYTLRISPTSLQGWAPACLVAAGGITGAVVTVDTTTFGATGFAPSQSDGGARFFEVGDAVRLVEIGSATPTASTQHTVGAVSGTTITLNPAPSAGFATLAAAALKVMVIPDDWTVVSASQQLYAYLSNASYRLDTNTRSRVYAS